MQYKLLLINPWIYDFTAYDLWSKPLGLLYLASFLQQFGFEISFIDCLDKYAEEFPSKVKKYGQGTFRREIVEKPPLLEDIPRKFARYGISESYFREQLIASGKPDAILVTSLMTYWYLGPQKVVNIIREIYPGVPVILGGVYATLLPEHAKQAVNPDYIVTGPGEIKILKLLADLFAFEFDSSQLPNQLDDYPYPAFDLINHPDYLLIMTARGCPYDCSFCAHKQIAMPFTQRTPESVVNELEFHYKKYKIRDFAFYDDALFIRKKFHIQKILAGLIDKRLPLRLHSPNGLFARYIDEELAQLMYQSNFKTIRISFETSNEQRRKDMYSKVTNQDMISAVANLEKAGYKRSDLEAYVLMGLPNQDLEEVLASLIFINNLGVQSRLASFSPIPGTLDFERAVQAGLIANDIDPLLTNKSIFPLRNGKLNYQNYQKVRQFSHMLNEAARRGIAVFGHDAFATSLKNVVKGMQ